MKSINDELKIEQFTSLYTKAITNLLYTSGWITDKLNLICKEKDISIQQYSVLRILKNSIDEPLSIKYIKERMMNKNSNTSRLVEKLKQKGLLERHPSATNRRKVDISITREGLEIYTEITPRLVDHNNYISKGFTEKEAELLDRLLSRLRN